MSVPSELLELLRDIIIKVDSVDSTLTVIHPRRPLTAAERTLIVTNLAAIRDFYSQSRRAWRVTLVDGTRAYLYTELLLTPAEVETKVRASVGDLLLAVEPIIN